MSRRRKLYLAGLLPLLLVTLYAAKVALLLVHDGDGRGAFADADYDAASSAFAGNRSLNLLEPWVAPFDQGVARHAAGAYDDALTDYAAALEDAPAEEECTVRINAALAREAIGDAKIEMPDREAAIEAWQAGIDTLDEGDCPEAAGRGPDQAADATAVRDRLEQKIEEQQPDQPQDQPEQQEQPQDQPQQQEERDKEKMIQRRNQAGVEERRDDEEFQRELDSDGSLDGKNW